MTDKESFCTAVHRCENAMYAVAFSLVRNEADAGEVISESIFRAYRCLDTLKNQASFKPWILRIVHNTAVEMLRQNARVVLLDDVEEPVADGGEARLTTRLALREAVSRLRQPYRTAVILFYYEDMSAAAIARCTGSSVPAVKKQLSRAREMLREMLKEEMDS